MATECMCWKWLPAALVALSAALSVQGGAVPAAPCPVNEIQNTLNLQMKSVEANLKKYIHAELDTVKTALEVCSQWTQDSQEQYNERPCFEKYEYSSGSSRNASNAAVILNAINRPEAVELVGEILRGVVGSEAVRRAAREGRCDLLAALLAVGAKDAETVGASAIEIAFDRKYVRCVAALRKHDVRLSGAKWEQALCDASINSRHEEVAALLAAGVNPNTVGRKGYTALFEAAEVGCLKCVQVLLRSGADKNGRSREWFKGTPLMVAAKYDKVDVVEALLSAGADTNIKMTDGDTALHLALRYGRRIEVVRALLAAGADTTAKFAGRTPLEHAKYYRNAEGARVLQQRA